MDKIKAFFKPENLVPFVKRHWRIGACALTAVLAVVILVVAVGSGAGAPEPTVSTNGAATGNTTATQNKDPIHTTAATDPTVPTTAVPLPYTHPLTGEALAEPMLGRPIAVMLNNARAAMPQHGVSQADIVYETLTEGGVTRCMGIFTNPENVEKIGAIRSARLYFVQMAQGYGASYVHAGGSKEANNYLASLKDMDLDAGRSATYFYRDQDRLNNGYALEHTLFTSGSMLLDYARERKVATEVEQEMDYGMHFDDSAVLEGSQAEKVTVYFHIWQQPTSLTKTTTLTYNAQDQLYYAFQHGADYVDGNGGAPAFRNIVVIRTYAEVQADQNHLTIENVGSGEGHFIRDGKTVAIRWSRETVNDPFRFSLENGEDVQFGVGSTYIAVIASWAQVTFA